MQRERRLGVPRASEGTETGVQPLPSLSREMGGGEESFVRFLGPRIRGTSCRCSRVGAIGAIAALSMFTGENMKLYAWNTWPVGSRKKRELQEMTSTSPCERKRPRVSPPSPFSLSPSRPTLLHPAHMSLNPFRQPPIPPTTSDSKAPADGPPSYDSATDASSTLAIPHSPSTASSSSSNTTSQVPANDRSSFDEDERELPDGWVRSYDPTCVSPSPLPCFYD